MIMGRSQRRADAMNTKSRSFTAEAASAACFKLIEHDFSFLVIPSGGPHSVLISAAYFTSTAEAEITAIFDWAEHQTKQEE